MDEQIELDNAILQISDYINDLNSKAQLATPRTACHVHKWRHNRIGHRYDGTLNDGIHYNDDDI